MAIWNSRGLRGSGLEEEINLTNEKYRDAGLALVQKIPTPITPIEMDKEHGHITLAYFEQKSTVDYIGAVQGIPICFDAKECREDAFPLKNIHSHQLRFMEDMERQGGVAFLIVSFVKHEACYYLRFQKLMEFIAREQAGGRKSFRIEEMEQDFLLEEHSGFLIPYLDGLQKDLEYRDKDTD